MSIKLDIFDSSYLTRGMSYEALSDQKEETLGTRVVEDLDPDVVENYSKARSWDDDGGLTFPPLCRTLLCRAAHHSLPQPFRRSSCP